ncbi:MAG: GldG family protein [Spirochaetes bacterium]|nr:GldG family protein [Spirochaetota bacterium]
MNLAQLSEKFRNYLSQAMLASLLLFYFAANFSTKSFGYLVTLTSAILLMVACGVALYTLYNRKSGAFRTLQIGYWLSIVALVCYFVQIDFFWQKFVGESPSSSVERFRQILQIVYFSAFTIALVIFFLNAAVRIEAREAATSLITLGGLLFLLVALNYWAHLRPAAVDMTLMRKFSLSHDSKEILRGIEGEVKVTAFYPFFSDLYRDVELVLRDAASANGKISYTFIDPLREKNLADEKKVDRIGTILVEAKDATEKNAKKSERVTRFEIVDEDGIKRFERELVSNILQVSGQRKNIYYLQGHDEKSVSGNSKEDTIGIFDENLRALRHYLKPLTVAEGFPQKMPAADLVLVIGPRRDFTALEKQTLKKYFDDGGKIFIAADPETQVDFSFLLEPLKVKFVKQRVHSDLALPPGKTTIQSINYSEHAITAPFVKRSDDRKVTIFPGVGYLEADKETNPDYDINYFLLSHFTSWIDAIPNGLRDDKKEAIASYKIGMAVKSKKGTGRLVFIGDSDFLVNRFIDMQQNKELAMRALGWLTENEQATGIVAGRYDDEKVKLTGTRDTVIFHLFFYIYPGLILLVGFFVVRAKRRRMSEMRSTEK